MAKPAPPAEELREGIKLGQWTLGRELGKGAFGAVYEAFDKNGDGGWAAKVVQMALQRGRKGGPPITPMARKTGQSPEFMSLNQERNMYLNRLGKHRNIPDVPFLGGCGRDKGYAYIVMPQMGRTIKEVFQESGPFSGDNIALLAMQMIEVLEHIHHKKHIYRDMKPSNVMFGTGASESSDSNIAYLVDYGTAETSLEFDGTVKSGDIAGTPKFMSVDVQTGGPFGVRDDIISLVYMLAELAEGSLPWSTARSNEEMAEMKRTVPPSALSPRVPEIGKLLELVVDLPPNASLDYSRMKKLFQARAARAGSFDFTAEAAEDGADAVVSKRSASRRRSSRGAAGGSAKSRRARGGAGAGVASDRKHAQRGGARSRPVSAKPSKRSATKRVRRAKKAVDVIVIDSDSAASGASDMENEPQSSPPKRARRVRARKPEACSVSPSSERITRSQSASPSPASDAGDSEGPASGSRRSARLQGRTLLETIGDVLTSVRHI